MNKAEKLKRLRGGRPYAEVARGAGCSPPTIREIESGRTSDPGSGLMLGLARYFTVDVTWLIDDSADWPPPESDKQRASSLIEQALASYGLARELSELECSVLAMMRGVPETVRYQVLAYISGRAADYGISEEQKAAEAAELKARLRAALEDADAEHDRKASGGRRASGG